MQASAQDPHGALLRLTAGYNANRTRVTRVDTSTILSGHTDQLFNRVERARIEVGQPRDNVLLSANPTAGRLGLLARTQRFGRVTSFGSATNGSGDQTYGAKWVSDVSLIVGPITRTTVTFGADNVFDVYPDQPIPANDLPLQRDVAVRVQRALRLREAVRETLRPGLRRSGPWTRRHRRSWARRRH